MSAVIIHTLATYHEFNSGDDHDLLVLERNELACATDKPEDINFTIDLYKARLKAAHSPIHGLEVHYRLKEFA